MVLRADAQRNLDRVLDAAETCFAERGLDASVDEVARRAGVGHGTVFRRFPTKEALVVAVVTRRIEELTAAAEAALERDDAGEGFAEFFANAAEVYRRSRGLTGGLQRCVGTREVDELRRAVGRLVRRAQKAGALRRGVDADDVLRLVPTAADYFEIVLDGLRVSAS
jgi:AcrR family transcriptional regulator